MLKIGKLVFQFYFLLVKKPDALFGLILVGPWLIFIFFFIKELIIFQEPKFFLYTWGFHIFMYRIGMVGMYVSKNWARNTFTEIYHSYFQEIYFSCVYYFDHLASILNFDFLIKIFFCNSKDSEEIKYFHENKEIKDLTPKELILR